MDSLWMSERERLLATVIACLVDQLGGEARIAQADLEEPPDIEQDEDPFTGEWIYRIK